MIYWNTKKKYEELLKNIIGDLKSLSEKYQAQTEKKESIDYESIVENTPKLFDKFRHTYSISTVEKDISIKPSFYLLETFIQNIGSEYGISRSRYVYKITGYFYYDVDNEAIIKIKNYLINNIKERISELDKTAKLKLN